ncbi:MAG: hypothetical protein HN842_02730 [Gammaproteobacteria bacterium]|nr:hypothetical protein [Gammaproteobacteria bacterium]
MKNTHHIPEGATAEISGFFYKIGRFDFPYRWTGTQWIRTTMRAATVINGKLKGVA